MRKVRLYRVAIVATVFALLFSVVSLASAAQYKIGIIQFVEHPALDASREGLLAEFEDTGFIDKVDIEYQNAQGDASLLATITRNMINNRVDLFQPIATPPAQTVLGMARNTPIVFSAVRDPISAGLIDSFEQPGGNITGSSHYQPAWEQAGLILEIFPDTKRIGLIYNAGEDNSVSQVMDVREWAKEVGLTVVERTVSQSVEVQQAAESMVGQVDVFYVGTDNTVVAGLEGLINVSYRAKIPVIAADVDTVERGALAAYGADFFKLGRLTAQLVMQVLEGGADAGSIPIAMEEDRDLALNLTGAAEMGLDLPPAVVDRATMRY